MAKQKCRFNLGELKDHWGKGKSISCKGKQYKIGKMSYGDYFLEPIMTKREIKKYHGETKPFHPKTLWLEKTKENPNIYST